MVFVHPLGQIEQHNFTLRGQRVVLDADLAALFGVETKRLNENFKRAAQRFPPDYRFQMTWEEMKAREKDIGMKEIQVANCDQTTTNPHVANCDPDTNPKSPSSTPPSPPSRLPYVYSEQGALMAAIVLRNSRAMYTCAAIVHALVILRARDRLRQESPA